MPSTPEIVFWVIICVATAIIGYLFLDPQDLTIKIGTTIEIVLLCAVVLGVFWIFDPINAGYVLAKFRNLLTDLNNLPQGVRYWTF